MALPSMRKIPITTTGHRRITVASAPCTEFISTIPASRHSLKNWILATSTQSQGRYNMSEQEHDEPDFYPTESRGVVGLVDSVFLRPAMYVVNGTLEEAFCFLEGFYCGMISHNPRTGVWEEAKHKWFGFLEWVGP